MPAPITVGLEQARSQLPTLAAAAHAGKPSLITRHGKPYAALVSPAILQHRVKSGPTLLSLRGSGAGLWSQEARAAVADLRDEWE